MSDNLTLRVFVSSTSRDMHAARDRVVKAIFARPRDWFKQLWLPTGTELSVAGHRRRQRERDSLSGASRRYSR
jgi:hypothetical protein